MPTNWPHVFLSLSLLPSLSLSFVVLPQADVFSEPIGSSPQAPVKAPSTYASDDPLPVILWHGLGDSAGADGLASVADLIDEVNPGTYVHIISVGEPSDDRRASWFGDLNLQLDLVCHELAADPVLSTAPAVDAIGFSQGGQFLRAYQQRCGHWAPKIRNLITFGSQHNGIAEFQRCKSATDFICQGANALLKGSAVWSDFIQKRVVPAQYYRDTKDYENYLEHSNFLADINNEREKKNTTYADNIAALNKFVMIVFADDTTVIPRDSGWFSEVDADKGNVTSLRNLQLYKEDWLGLKRLDEKKGLVFDSVKGGHMHLDDKDLTRLFKQYFGPVDLDQTEP